MSQCKCTCGKCCSHPESVEEKNKGGDHPGAR